MKNLNVFKVRKPGYVAIGVLLATVTFSDLLLSVATSPLLDSQNYLYQPNEFVAGPSFTQEEFNTPISSLNHDQKQSDQVPPCTILVPESKNGIAGRLWPNRRMPYVISAVYNANQRQIIASAMNEYVKNTCITFVERTDESDYIVITEGGSGCTSYVGRIGGPQTVSLDPGCVATYIVIHELMHAAGFWHEQSRVDRDDYVDINWDNIVPGYAFAFDKYSSAQLLGTLYDYGSVMHYTAYSFAINSNIPTITAKDGSQLGNYIGFTSNDIFKLNRLYSCNADDTCWDDEVRNCPSLVASGMCSIKPQEMMVRCRKSCGFCNQPVCQDENPNCIYWQEVGECQANPAYMLQYCKWSCRSCTYDPSITTTMPASLPTASPPASSTSTTILTTTTGNGGFVCQSDGNFPSAPCSSVFYMCSNGYLHIMDCPLLDLVFSADLGVCDWESNVPACGNQLHLKEN